MDKYIELIMAEYKKAEAEYKNALVADDTAREGAAAFHVNALVLAMNNSPHKAEMVAALDASA